MKYITFLSGVVGAILSGKVFELSLAGDCEIQALCPKIDNNEVAPNESLPCNQGP